MLETESLILDKAKFSDWEEMVPQCLVTSEKRKVYGMDYYCKRY